MTEDAVSLEYETNVCAALHAPHTRTALVTQCGKPTYPAVGSGPTSAISVVAKMIEPMGCHPDPNTNKQTNHTHAQIPPMWALSGLHSRAHKGYDPFLLSHLLQKYRNAGPPCGHSCRTLRTQQKNAGNFALPPLEPRKRLHAELRHIGVFKRRGYHSRANKPTPKQSRL
jgi:hypothetical protein